MQGYFDRLKEAAQQAKGTKPVIFFLEPDLHALMQMYTNIYSGTNGIVADDPTTIPAQALHPDYPDTFAGVMKRMIDIVHNEAPNALVGLHAAAWATGQNAIDSPYWWTDIEGLAKRTVDFLLAAGGDEADLLFVGWTAWDAGSGKASWWDDTNRSLPNVNRALRWENVLSAASGKRLILTGVPVGNMNIPNNCKGPGCSQCQDNRLDYAFAHASEFSPAGIIGLILGAPNPGMTCPSTDGGNVEKKARAFYARPLTVTTTLAGPTKVAVAWSPSPFSGTWTYRIRFWPSTKDELYETVASTTSLTLSLPYAGDWSLDVSAVDSEGNTSPPTAVSITLYNIYFPLILKKSDRSGTSISSPHQSEIGESGHADPRLLPSGASPSIQRGMNYAAWWQGLYRTPESDTSLENLADTGTKWLALIVTGYQETITSTTITRLLPRTPTDEDLVHVIAKAHSLGMKVMLKPHVDLNNDPAHWRGQIGFDNEADWDAWFASYRDFINHYAELAQSNGVEQFCVGTELEGTSGRESDWRQVIAEVRKRFSGPITYASNKGGEETNIKWWDAVDYIGVDAYYPLTNKNDPTFEELKAAWESHLAILEDLANLYGKQIIITEIGYRSIDGANKAPWDWQSSGTIDLQEQADCYRAFFETFWNRPWLAGVYWWMWWADPAIGGATDDSYTPYKKPAEDVLRAYYAPVYNIYLPLITMWSSFP
jgi:hypothetical protein